jgi:hypothetical protein
VQDEHIYGYIVQDEQPGWQGEHWVWLLMKFANVLNGHMNVQLPP